MDFIETILSRYTDFTKFEDLANEIMIQQGYMNLVPAGGVHDGSVDAQMVRYFEQKEHNIIFQYSMRQDTKAKIYETYETIRGKGKKCDQLIIVTTMQVNNKEEVKQVFRNKYGVSPTLEIYDRQTFKSRLGTQPQLLNRYFPNYRSQLESDLSQGCQTEDNGSKSLTRSLFMASIAFTGNTRFTESHKKTFDSMVKYFLLSLGQCNIDQIHQKLCSEVNAEISRDRIASSLDRLINEGRVTLNDGNYEASKKDRIEAEEVINRAVVEKEALINDIIFKAQGILDQTLDSTANRIAAINIENSLTDYIKMYAMERSLPSAESVTYIDFSSSIISKLKTGLPDRIAEAIIESVAHILQSPTPEQESAITLWSQSFVAAQVLKLDPKQNQIQAEELDKKNFVLDTDTALNLIIKEVKEHDTYVKIISRLLKYGVNIIIPVEVLDEIATHAYYAPNSFYRFNNKSHALDSAILEEEIGNVFARGYFTGRGTGRLPASMNFEQYMANYYHKASPIEYLKEFIHDNVDNRIVYIDLASIELTEVNYSHFEDLQQRILQLTLATPKASYRDLQENEAIARVDARMYLNFWQENNKVGATASKFKYMYYVLTKSNRAPRCAKQIGIDMSFYVRPLNALALIDKIEPFELSYSEITNIFENPYLTYVVKENWPIIEKVIERGFDLKNANLTKLKWELAELLEDELLTQSPEDEAKQNDTGETKKQEEETDFNEYVSTMEAIRNKGYHLMPEVSKLYELLMGQLRKNAIDEAKLAALEEEINKYSMRKKRYFKRMSREVKVGN